MFKQLRTIAAISILILSVTGFAKDSPIPSVQLINFSERLSKDAPVSGRVLVGAVIERPGAKATAENPILMWTRAAVTAPGKSLCVSSVSRDGLYFSEGSLSPATLADMAGPVRLTGGKSKDAVKFIQRLKLDEFATLAYLGDCGTSPTAAATPTVVLVDQAEGATVGSRRVKLFINSQRQTTSVYAKSPTGQVVDATCIEPEDGRRTAFDIVCTFEPPNATAKVSVAIERKRYERVLSPVRFDIQLPSP